MARATVGGLGVNARARGRLDQWGGRNGDARWERCDRGRGIVIEKRDGSVKRVEATVVYYCTVGMIG